MGGGGMGHRAGGPFCVGAIQCCWQGVQGASVRPSGSLLRDSDVLAKSLGVAFQDQCMKSQDVVLSVTQL